MNNNINNNNLAGVSIQNLNIEKSNFFFAWLTLLEPFVKLKLQEKLILSALLSCRQEIIEDSNNTLDENLINKLIFSSETREKIKKELNINSYSFNNCLSRLRNKRIISKDNQLNNKIIPNLEKDFKEFRLILNINILC